MEIKLDTLKLRDYNDNYIKEKFQLLNDYSFKKYFGDFFIRDADEYFVSSDSLEPKKVYLVFDDENVVGITRIFSYHEAGFINIQYAILEQYRNKGYAKKLLKEFTKYLTQKCNIRCVELDIDKYNIGSIKAAIDSGFNLENDKYKFRK